MGELTVHNLHTNAHLSSQLILSGWKLKHANQYSSFSTTSSPSHPPDVSSTGPRSNHRIVIPNIRQSLVTPNYRPTLILYSRFSPSK